MAAEYSITLKWHNAFKMLLYSWTSWLFQIFCYSVIQQIFLVQILYVRCCARHWGCNRKQDRLVVSVLKSLHGSVGVDIQQKASSIHCTMKAIKDSCLRGEPLLEKDPKQISLERCDLSWDLKYGMKPATWRYISKL